MGRKTAINSFEGELAIALKTAAVQAAANLIRANPELTLEDFYTVMRPQGVTETITVGELSAALAGEAVVPLLPHAPAPAPKKKAIAPTSPTKSGKPRKPRKPPKVNCLSRAGQEAYHQSILRYLAAVDDWVRSPDIMEHCGGNKGQIGSALRKHLVASGYVKVRGKTYGMEFCITSKGKRKAASGSPVTVARSTTKHEAAAGADGVNARTDEGRAAYHTAILRYLRKARGAWRTGVQISGACGGNKSQRNRALNNMLAEGLVEDNGERRQAKRWRSV